MMKNQLNVRDGQDGLTNYLHTIKGHELLTRDQERMLAGQYQDQGDIDAGQRLVQANLRLVVSIAVGIHRFSSRYALEDLIQQGNMGLVHAVEKYDGRKKTKFSYYATFWIKAYIYQYIMNNYSIVKIGKTQAQRKLFFNLHKTKQALYRQGLDATPSQIAERIGVTPREVTEMDNQTAHRPLPLNAPVNSDSREQRSDHFIIEEASAEDQLADHQMVEILHQILDKFKQHLDDRELAILEQRIVSEEPSTLQSLGDYFGVSRERIRQIEKYIIADLRKFFKNQIPDFNSYLVN